MHAFFKSKSPSGSRDPKGAFVQQYAANPLSFDGAICLKEHQHLRMRDACGSTVRALAGTIWITQDGDLRDIVLEAGESFVIDREHTVLLSPLSESKIVVERGTCCKAANRRRGTASSAFRFPVPRALRTRSV